MLTIVGHAKRLRFGCHRMGLRRLDCRYAMRDLRPEWPIECGLGGGGAAASRARSTGFASWPCGPVTQAHGVRLQPKTNGRSRCGSKAMQLSHRADWCSRMGSTTAKTVPHRPQRNVDAHCCSRWVCSRSSFRPEAIAIQASAANASTIPVAPPSMPPTIRVAGTPPPCRNRVAVGTGGAAT